MICFGFVVTMNFQPPHIQTKNEDKDNMPRHDKPVTFIFTFYTLNVHINENKIDHINTFYCYNKYGSIDSRLNYTKETDFNINCCATQDTHTQFLYMDLHFHLLDHLVWDLVRLSAFCCCQCRHHTSVKCCLSCACTRKILVTKLLMR